MGIERLVCGVFYSFKRKRKVKMQDYEGVEPSNRCAREKKPRGTNTIQYQKTYVRGAELIVLPPQLLSPVRKQSERHVAPISKCAWLPKMENCLKQFIALFLQCKQTQQGPATQMHSS